MTADYRYQLRLSFDPGSGICLWSMNPAANQEFGYNVDHWALPLGANTKHWLDHLIAWFDTSLDWDDPGGPLVWTEEEYARFNAAAQRGLSLLRADLPGERFEIVERSPPS